MTMRDYWPDDDGVVANDRRESLLAAAHDEGDQVWIGSRSYDYSEVPWELRGVEE